jgi:spore germination cell wall hydrolase CwlJ-like protein
MHMTPNLNLGMLKQNLFLLVKAILLTLAIGVFFSAYADEPKRTYSDSMTSAYDWLSNQIRNYENETWEQRVRRLMRTNLDEAGGAKKATGDKQVKCLAENIYYESRGESLVGQVAVAKVTMNRVLEGYASTVCGVVKQRSPGGCQFSWVCNGKGNPPASDDLWTQAVSIALVTINEAEKVEDPTSGATHFHATYINWKPAWKQVTDSVSQIGNHVFYRVKPKEEK